METLVDGEASRTCLLPGAFISAMESSQAPLLERQNSSQTSSDASEDLERGLDSGAGHDFRHLIDSQPEAVIKCAFICM